MPERPNGVVLKTTVGQLTEGSNPSPSAMPDSLVLAVDPSSTAPPFEQVRSQLANAISTGALAAEERLPPIRQLASELGLAVNTVARAYRELEAAGVVETRGRNGTVVVGTPTDARREAARATHAFVAEMTGLGIAPAEMVAMLSRELNP
jgi:DNA-binding transcriptional regulator YhcF (GntR family)